MTEYPKKLGPYRCTADTWDLLDRAHALSGITKREIVERGVASSAQAIINGLGPEPTTNGGTTNARSTSSAERGQAHGPTEVRQH